MAFPYLLLATQAAGLGLNLYANRQASKIEGLGYDVDQGQLNTRMQQELLVASQQQLSDLGRLQETQAVTKRAYLQPVAPNLAKVVRVRSWKHPRRLTKKMSAPVV